MIRKHKLTVQEVIEQVDRLPELPQVALRLSRMMENPSTSANQLSELIKLDPNLTTQVLRLCNSAAYGFTRKIGTIPEAVAILGFNTLKSMVYTILSHSTLNKQVQGYGLEKGALWKNSITCAVYAKRLAEIFKYPDPELAFTGALLRDTGKIILGEFVGESYQAIEEQATSKQIGFVEAERDVLGVSHTDVGVQIAERWNLPEKLIKVIGYHHNPSSLDNNEDANVIKLVSIVHLADIYTMLIGCGTGSDGLMYLMDLPAIEKLGISIEGPDLERLLSELIDLNVIIMSFSEAF